MNWHYSDTAAVTKELATGDKGLTTDEARKRLEQYGSNALESKGHKTAWSILIAQFKDLMIVILAVAAIISAVAGDLTDAIIILVIVILNALVGFIQEFRAEKAMEALQKMAAPKAQVMRDGKATQVEAEELVPGDVVLLEAGVIVPADLRLTETHALRIEEAALTGEAAPVDKTADTLKEEEPPLGDRFNMAYKSAMVTKGRGTGVVVATGMKTEVGKIAEMLQGKEGETPLQKRMADFGRKLTYIVVGICVVLFGLGLLRGESVVTMLLTATSLAVAAIPEALPALITIALARGASRLVTKNALIRKLPAVETLGSVNFICTDKTGTLTQNRMEVTDSLPADKAPVLGKDIPLLYAAMALNQDAKKNDKNEWTGDPTEIALIRYVVDKYPEEEVKAMLDKYPRVAELPFDSDRKRMSTIHQYGDKYLLITKGAAESLEPLFSDKQAVDIMNEASNDMATKGMRVLAYGYRELDTKPAEQPDENELEKDLQYAGITGMIDPPREEVKAAIAECKTAGIQPVMITGDHLQTAAAIGRDIGLLKEDDEVIAGTDLAKLSEEELDQRVKKIKVYARVSPEQKLNIVKSLQRTGNYAAMTGDGVNDAPSLRAANIGIAMGITGTDVSKEAAHMILLDDNFATIVRAVREGRRIYDNIRKFVKYIMTCNGAEIWTFILAPLIGLPIPLQPVHILWINLVTDGLPGLALATEKEEKNIMKRPPADPKESLFARSSGIHIIWVGLLMTAVTLGTQAWAIHIGDTHWQTMVFTVLSLSQLGHVMAIRSDELIITRGVFSNLPLVGAVLLTFGLQMAVIYLPPAQGIFKTQPLTLTELGICMGLSTIVFIAVEIEKLIKRLLVRRK
ncbi:cation-translocating P-type ATPase [Chitinophaga horti]|uniref:Cation-translocating P-type ATPase n=1 Tax=Chitinophaga horti TaxID=2920382 RepID=A0ABY6J7E6_9BACT|nr:cation-translocating P-type ATPase [Chitinophaga horti]UYQ95410.1 cation-translocating P-type ATPase [Chitinophaga horti]